MFRVSWSVLINQNKCYHWRLEDGTKKKWRKAETLNLDTSLDTRLTLYHLSRFNDGPQH